MRTTIILAAVLALAITLGPAYYHGKRTFRWGQDRELLEMAARLAEFPEQLGAWQMTNELDLQRVELDQLEPVGYIARTYSQGDHSATVFILLGPTGPTAAHTPDICFNSRMYRAMGDRRRVPVDPAGADLGASWVIRFEARTVDQHYLKAWYAWTVDGIWHASDQPRFEFADSRFLVKIQIAVLYPDQQTMDQDGVGEEFVKLVRGCLTDALFR